MKVKKDKEKKLIEEIKKVIKEKKEKNEEKIKEVEKEREEKKVTLDKVGDFLCLSKKKKGCYGKRMAFIVVEKAIEKSKDLEELSNKIFNYMQEIEKQRKARIKKYKKYNTGNYINKVEYELYLFMKSKEYETASFCLRVLDNLMYP